MRFPSRVHAQDTLPTPAMARLDTSKGKNLPISCRRTFRLCWLPGNFLQKQSRNKDGGPRGRVTSERANTLAVSETTYWSTTQHVAKCSSARAVMMQRTVDREHYIPQCTVSPHMCRLLHCVYSDVMCSFENSFCFISRLKQNFKENQLFQLITQINEQNELRFFSLNNLQSRLVSLLRNTVWLKGSIILSIVLFLSTL